MSNRTWFRFYVNALGNEKLRKLSDREFRLWILLLCAYCEKQVLPAVDDLAWKLRISQAHCKRLVEKLSSPEIRLLDAVGDSWAPHNWDSLQFENDTSKTRTARYRARLRLVPPSSSEEGVLSSSARHCDGHESPTVTVTCDVTKRSRVTASETETEQSRNGDEQCSVSGAAHAPGPSLPSPPPGRTTPPKTANCRAVEFIRQARHAVPLREPDLPDIERVRQNLIEFTGGSKGFAVSHWGAPDDEICRKCLTVADGVTVPLIEHTLGEIYRDGKKPSQSWAWFPTVLEHYLVPKKLAKV